MKITEYGKLVRKARLDAEVTMLDMARSIGVAPSFLSATEVGAKKVSVDFLQKVEEFFRTRGIVIKGLREAADVSNRSVPLDGLSPAQQFLVAGFARTKLTKDQVETFTSMLRNIREGNRVD